MLLWQEGKREGGTWIWLVASLAAVSGAAMEKLSCFGGDRFDREAL